MLTLEGVVSHRKAMVGLVLRRFPMTSKPPLVAHIVYRFDYGGLENGLINLINKMPHDRFRHAIICLSGYSAFRRRLQRRDVDVFALNKRAGKDLRVYLRLWRLLRRLRPDIVHSRNIGTMDCPLIARLAGVPVRIHGEHGWDVDNLDGENRHYRRLRKLFDPGITRYVVVSADLGRWLASANGVPEKKITRIVNGVDTTIFQPRTAERSKLPASLREPGRIVFGTVGRMHPVKNPMALAQAYLRLLDLEQTSARRFGLVMVGDGPLREQVCSLFRGTECAAHVWLPGARDDVPEIMREMDVFVLPSLNEGISNTVLEAMASGLPVIAANVGGNPELVVDSQTGRLTFDSSTQAFVDAMTTYLAEPALVRRHGDAGRRRVLDRYKLDSMIANYVGLYDSLLAEKN